MRFKKSSNFLLSVNVKVLRDLCEVEFWEVFYKGARVFSVVPQDATC